MTIPNSPPVPQALKTKRNWLMWRLVLKDGDESPNTHIWSDGNFGCDCNRRIFFNRTGGKDKGVDGECSEGLYSVRVRNKKSGRVFYSEFDR